MAYRFHAEVVEADVLSHWDDDRGCQVDVIGPTFYRVQPSGRSVLTLSRELLSDEVVTTFLSGPIIVLDEGRVSDGGITLVELSRDHIRVRVDAAAAERIGEEEIVVTFDADERLFEHVRGELATVFRDRSGVYRELSG